MSISGIRRAVLALAVGALTVPALVALMAPASVASTGSRPTPGGTARLRAACPTAANGYVRCFALYRPEVSVNRAIAAGVAGKASKPIGLTPSEI